MKEKYYRHTIRKDMTPEDLVTLMSVMQFTATIVEEQLMELPVHIAQHFRHITQAELLQEALEDGEAEIVAEEVKH